MVLRGCETAADSAVYSQVTGLGESCVLMDSRKLAAPNHDELAGLCVSRVPTSSQSVQSAASDTHMKGPTLTSPCAGSLPSSGSLVHLGLPCVMQ